MTISNSSTPLASLLEVAFSRMPDFLRREIDHIHLQRVHRSGVSVSGVSLEVGEVT